MAAAFGRLLARSANDRALRQTTARRRDNWMVARYSWRMLRALNHLLYLLALLLPAAAGANCYQPAAPCDLIDARDNVGPGRVLTIERSIIIAPDALPLERPLSVHIAALASSEVYWNGRRIGSNGRLPDATHAEVAGRYFASFDIARDAVRAGDNQLRIRFSADHLWTPLVQPIHLLEIGPYETPALPSRAHYLPTLVALGLLAVCLAYFLVAACLEPRGARHAILPALLAMLSMAQALAEVARSFVDYPYPWHLVRVGAIAILATASALTLSFGAATRFWPEMRRSIVAIATAVSMGVLLWLPGFDYKSLAVVAVGQAAMLAAAAHALWRTPIARNKAAGVALVIGTVALLTMTWEGGEFLDRSYYYVIASLLIASILEQLGLLRAQRMAQQRISELEERLRHAEAAGEPIIALKNGSREHRLAIGDIIFLRAADDYVEVRTADGRNLLVTKGLTRLLDELPGDFLRIHKSYAVARSAIRAVEVRRGGGRQVRLADGATIPVGRRFAGALQATGG